MGGFPLLTTRWLHCCQPIRGTAKVALQHDSPKIATRTGYHPRWVSAPVMRGICPRPLGLGWAVAPFGLPVRRPYIIVCSAGRPARPSSLFPTGRTLVRFQHVGWTTSEATVCEIAGLYSKVPSPFSSRHGVPRQPRSAGDGGGARELARPGGATRPARGQRAAVAVFPVASARRAGAVPRQAHAAVAYPSDLQGGSEPGDGGAARPIRYGRLGLSYPSPLFSSALPSLPFLPPLPLRTDARGASQATSSASRPTRSASATPTPCASCSWRP